VIQFTCWGGVLTIPLSWLAVLVYLVVRAVIQPRGGI
jgi:hypothetical protein